MTTNSSEAGNLYQARMGPNSNTKTPETHNLDAQTSSNCFEKKRRCYNYFETCSRYQIWNELIFVHKTWTEKTKGSVCGHWTPSLTGTLPSRTLPLPQHDEDSRFPVYFGHFIPFGHFILLFLFNKSISEAWLHTHCVCRFLFPPHHLNICYVICSILFYCE